MMVAMSGDYVTVTIPEHVLYAFAKARSRRDEQLAALKLADEALASYKEQRATKKRRGQSRR